jgi:hypothetical protein
VAPAPPLFPNPSPYRAGRMRWARARRAIRRRGASESARERERERDHSDPQLLHSAKPGRPGAEAPARWRGAAGPGPHAPARGRWGAVTPARRGPLTVITSGHWPLRARGRSAAGVARDGWGSHGEHGGGEGGGVPVQARRGRPAAPPTPCLQLDRHQPVARSDSESG